MTIFSLKTLVAASAFTVLTAAFPMAVDKRDAVTSWWTQTDYTTVDVPVTLWVDEQGHPLSTGAPQGGFFGEKTGRPAATTPAESPKVETSALQSSASYTSASVVPTTIVTTTPALVVPTTTPAAVYTPSAQTSILPTSASAQSTSTTSAAAPANKAPSGQTGTVYTGDITYYGGGLGACGWDVNTDTDFQIAMPYGMMGLASNDNPYCGKSVTIQNPNTLATVQVTVGDKCMGCEGGSIDLTEVVFNTIGGGCDGRCHGFEWWFN